MKKNIIIITLDAVRPDKLHLLKKFNYFMRTGSLFTNSITATPYTLASMHAILSGIYPIQNGVNGYLKVFRFKDDIIKTLTQYLKENGYNTRGDLVNKSLIPQQGFDLVTSYNEKENILLRHKKILSEMKQTGSPFFLYLHQAFLHTKLIEKVLKIYTHDDERYYAQKDENEKNYESYLSEIDNYASGLVEHAKLLGLLENSIIVMHSDHGASFGSRFGERIYGEFLYDETVRAFSLFVNPEYFPALKFDNTVSLIDIMPTIMEILDIKPSSKKLQMKGKSILSITKGQEKLVV